MLSFHVKFVQTRQTDGQTDRQTDNGKTICPRSFDTGAYQKRPCRLQMLSIWTRLELCLVVKSKPFPKPQILDSFKLKVFAYDSFKHDENGAKFSKRIENTVGNGEIACYKQFPLFPQCFQKIFNYRHVKSKTSIGKG